MADPSPPLHHLPQHHPSPARSATTPPVYSRDFAYAHGTAVVLVPRPMPIEPDNVASTSATSFAQLLSGPTVEIYVGRERKCWTLHRNLLCHHSSYFETEFQGHEVPRGPDRGSLELPDDDPRGFELLVKWLYQGHLEDVSDFIDDERKYDYAVACHKLYVLCDKFDMVQLKNLAIDQYRLGLHEAQLVPDAEEMDEIYRNSPHHSPFRKLMAKIAARQIMDPEVEKDAESYRKCFADNPDFAVEMINNIRAMSGGILFDDPTTPDDDCLYHDHIDGLGYHGTEKAKCNAKAITTSACE
ncbi:BTB/POZ domain [Teratosphaeria destructans]|uniref:BTB/POZ domain n=1 Tax=Teratosphaeria destructans TaxID=418781 RepID=A0A9W7W552_9PEZI|nr:BTB/POZ domain [Teratosphaeria destructans]